MHMHYDAVIDQSEEANDLGCSFRALENGIKQDHKTNWAGKQWQSLTRVPLSVFE